MGTLEAIVDKEGRVVGLLEWRKDGRVVATAKHKVSGTWAQARRVVNLAVHGK